jgi:hypothetical protein
MLIKSLIGLTLGVAALISTDAFATAVSNVSTVAPATCNLKVVNQTAAPVTVGVTNGASVTVSANAQESFPMNCSVLTAVSASAQYSRLVVKSSGSSNAAANFTMTLTAPKAAKNAPATSTKSNTYKLEAGMADYIWITTSQEICTVPGTC